MCHVAVWLAVCVLMGNEMVHQLLLLLQLAAQSSNITCSSWSRNICMCIDRLSNNAIAALSCK